MDRGALRGGRVRISRVGGLVQQSPALEPIGFIPPAVAEERYFAMLNETAMAASIKQNGLRQSRSGSDRHRAGDQKPADIPLAHLGGFSEPLLPPVDRCVGTSPSQAAKSRPNGSSKKTVLTETPKIDVRIPRDREGTFDPKLIQRYQRRFPGFDDKIVSMYARAMTVREIQGHLLELYGLEVSPDPSRRSRDAVLETVAEWQNRPLETSYPLVFFDAIRVKACPQT